MSHHVASNHDFIGVGLSFPFGVDATGGIGLVSNGAEIEQAIRIILTTSPGERAMRPEFGCAIQDYVFASGDATTAGRLAFEVRSALERWEPRIELTDVEVLVDALQRDRFWISVSYRVRATNSPRNLVFPFYTIPPER
jgi:uncharacterized protein